MTLQNILISLMIFFSTATWGILIGLWFARRECAKLRRDFLELEIKMKGLERYVFLHPRAQLLEVKRGPGRPKKNPAVTAGSESYM